MALNFSDPNTIVALGTLALACAAVAQFELLRRTSQRQLRAYVSFDSAALVDGTEVKPAPFVDRTDQPGIFSLIKNTGQTPARDVVHWSQMEVAPLGRVASMTPPLKLDISHSSYLPPEAISSKSQWLERSLSTQEKEGIKNGTYAIFLYGRIEYRDVFNKKHWSVYRLQYTNAAWPPYNNNGTFSHCVDGNSAD
jgi:hypothetical protein